MGFGVNQMIFFADNVPKPQMGWMDGQMATNSMSPNNFVDGEHLTQ